MERFKNVQTSKVLIFDTRGVVSYVLDPADFDFEVNFNVGSKANILLVTAFFTMSIENVTGPADVGARNGFTDPSR